MSEQGSQMLLMAGASIAAVIIALCLLRLIRTDDAGLRKVYRVVFSALAALLAPTLVAAGHGVLPIPFVAGIPILAYNLVAFADMEVYWLGLLGLGAGQGTGNAVVFTLPSLLVFAAVLFSPWSRARLRTPGAPSDVPR
jgi:hypothetical protein